MQRPADAHLGDVHLALFHQAPVAVAHLDPGAMPTIPDLDNIASPLRSRLALPLLPFGKQHGPLRVHGRKLAHHRAAFSRERICIPVALPWRSEGDDGAVKARKTRFFNATP